MTQMFSITYSAERSEGLRRPPSQGLLTSLPARMISESGNEAGYIGIFCFSNLLGKH